MKRDDVLSILHAHQMDLVNQYHIASLFVFGSVARDDAHTGSDVDLLVEFSQPIGLFMFIELQQRLETMLGCKVDLGTQRSLKPGIKTSILREAIRVT